MTSSKSNSEIKLKNNFTLSDDFALPTFDEWKEKLTVDLKGVKYEKLVSNTNNGIDLQPIYTKNDLNNLPTNDPYPGFDNNIRGSKSTGYLKNSWLISQNISYGDPEEFNAALKNDLNKGQTAISLSLDAASKLGLDADYAKKEDVGKSGVSISGLNSLSRALNGINIQKYPLFIESGFSSAPMLSILNAYCKQKNINISKIIGSVDSDPISYLVSFGNLPVALDFVFDKMSTSLAWTLKNAPNLKTINVSSLVYNNSGANEVHELSYILTSANEYIKQMLNSNFNIEEITRSIKVTVGIGSSFFTEISKFRALKLIWKNLIEAYGGSEEAQKVHIHSVTSSYNKTLFDPHVNMLRTTTEAFSAIMGGIDSLHVSPFDETFSIPDNFSRRIARNTQIILNEESYFTTPIDPAGGSYYVEALTIELAQSAWNHFQEIEKDGGMIEYLKSGKIQDEIAETSSVRNKLISKRKSVIVGTNMYSNPNEVLIETKSIDHTELQSKRAEFLQKFRTSGEFQKNNSIIEKLNSLADEKSEKLIEISSQAILEGATLGEITHSYRAGATESISVPSIKQRRAAEPFEELKLKMKEIEIASGEKPKVYLAIIGKVKQYKARADFARGFFETAGFDILYPNGFSSINETVEATINSDSKITVICSTDNNYKEVVPEYVKLLKEKNPEITTILAGYPKDDVEEYKKIGVDEFVYLGADAYSILQNLINNY